MSSHRPKIKSIRWRDDDRPTVWLGHSVRTTMLTACHERLAAAPHMVSLGDAVHRPNLLDRVFAEPLKPRLGLKGPLMLDSGGFTLLGRGGLLNATKLGRIYADTDADFVISLDAPTFRGERRAERMRKHQITRSNLTKLADLVEPRRLVPVIHGPTLDEVEAHAEHVMRVVPEARMVSLGGIVPLLRFSGRGSATKNTSRKLLHVAKAINLVRTILPGRRVHVLGAGSPTTVLGLAGLGADSLDSIGWRRAAGFGSIFVAGVGERFPSDHQRERRSRPIISASDRASLAKCTCPVCIASPAVEARVAAFAAKPHTPRAVHNAWTLLDEVTAYRRAVDNNNSEEWLKARLPPKWRIEIKSAV